MNSKGYLLSGASVIYTEAGPKEHHMMNQSGFLRDKHVHQLPIQASGYVPSSIVHRKLGLHCSDTAIPTQTLRLTVLLLEVCWGPKL